jgi:pimeloyl-[acyl-carrier protein] methyl ester esterase
MQSGIKIVLLPGMYGTAELFADFEKALPGEFAAERVSYPNDRFLSYAELLELVRSRVPASEPYVIVAESFSTPLAIQFAATHPTNLKGLVLSAGFATSPVRGSLRFMTPFLAPLMSRLPVNEYGARILVPGPIAPLSWQARLRAAIVSVKPRVLMDRVRAVAACDVLVELREVRVPILYMQARRDRLVNAVCLEEIRTVKPELEVVVLDGSHMLLQQMPDQTAEIVAEFVRRL